MAQVASTPKVERMQSRRFAGPVQRYTMQTGSAIPAQWMAYNTAGERVKGAGLEDYYGLVFNDDEEAGAFDDMCGQEAPVGALISAGFGTVTIEGPYARFATGAHISTMQAAWGEVYGIWLIKPEFRARHDAAVKYHPPAFNRMTGEGGYEDWGRLTAKGLGAQR